MGSLLQRDAQTEDQHSGIGGTVNRAGNREVQ
jgi:hypothetical protein